MITIYNYVLRFIVYRRNNLRVTNIKAQNNFVFSEAILCFFFSINKTILLCVICSYLLRFINRNINI